MNFLRQGLSLLICVASSPQAWASPPEVPSFLQQMAGCFAVTFNFVEDGDFDAFYQPTLEKATLGEVGGAVEVRRTLLIDGKEQDHWREEWRRLDPIENNWEQTVYGPFGDLRYRCSGTMLQSSWRCEAPKAAKPRRDKDRPYAYLDRENTLKVNGKRWIHMQRNVKRTSDGNIFAVELAWNQYDRQEASACQLSPSEPAPVN